ncbi:MAG: DNA-directed RNA polymerase subunit alpha C-terminal domain-containing protein [bacterium]|jgi:DNA-directed RNA polymerase subunit alpha
MSGLDTVIGGKAGNPEQVKKHLAEADRLEKAGDRAGAVRELRAANELSDDHGVTFKLAYMLDLLGEENEAVALYTEITSCRKPHINALINLAVICEDRGELGRAERLLRQVVETDPNHVRGRLFLKDVMASKDMQVETEATFVGPSSAILDTPVTDFELSVRARNCLKKMQIRTLGDLLKITEAELLSYKNFGEQSLVEIKAMLSQKGLRLGQNLEGGGRGGIRKDILEELKAIVPETTLNKPISSLELSVRARKALQLLNIATIGELASRTEAELMGVKNFGATSLHEIRERLAQHGLTLRQLA